LFYFVAEPSWSPCRLMAWIVPG